MVDQRNLAVKFTSKEKSMPKVGKKHYSYTAKGRAAARKQLEKPGRK